METSISDITIMTSFCMMQVFTKNLHHTKAGHNRTDISKVSSSIDTEHQEVYRHSSRINRSET